MTAQHYKTTLIHWQSGKINGVWRSTHRKIRLEYYQVSFSHQVPIPVKGHVLELHVQDSSKYLGVDIQSKLSWKNHIDRVTKKSNSMLGFLRWNLRSCSEETKAAYFSMVRSSLEYCCSIWSPNHKDQIGKIEMVQRRAARYTTNPFGNTSSVSSMLDHI